MHDLQLLWHTCHACTYIRVQSEQNQSNKVNMLSFQLNVQISVLKLDIDVESARLHVLKLKVLHEFIPNCRFLFKCLHLGALHPLETVSADLYQ